MTDRTRPGLVAFYYIRPGNGVGLFLQPPEPAWGMRKDSIYVLLLTGQHAAWSGVERGQLHQYSWVASIHVINNRYCIALCVHFSALTLLVGRPEGHPACKKLGVSLLVMMIWMKLCTSYNSSCYHHLQSITNKIISNKIHNKDILMLANPGPPGKWTLKRRERLCSK